MTEGYNFWNVTCKDFVNNTNTSIMYNFTVIKGPAEYNISLAQDNETVNISWSGAPYAQSYNIYIIDSYDDNFGPIPNHTTTESNYSDNSSANASRRFYKVAAVKGNVNKTSVKTVGKFEFELINNSDALTDWNLISIPLNITNGTLNNGSNNGYDIRVKPLYCLKALWLYNATTGEPKWTSFNGSAWLPASGSDNFTTIEAGRGYWAEVNKSCNITFVGEVPMSNLSVPLEIGWNVVGFHSPNSSRLPQNYQNPYPVVVNPANSVHAINRYNATTDQFEVTIHFTVSGNDWGWFPSSANRNFLHIDPTKGYYYDVLNPATWAHKPNSDKS